MLLGDVYQQKCQGSINDNWQIDTRFKCLSFHWWENFVITITKKMSMSSMGGENGVNLKTDKKPCTESWHIWNKKTYQGWYLHCHCPDCSSLYRYIPHHFGLLKYLACSDHTHFLEHYMESKLLWVWGIHQPCSQATHFFLSQHDTYFEEWYLEELWWKTVHVSETWVSFN